MHITRSRCTLYAAALLMVLSLLAMGVNFFYYRYPGNNYFPPHTPVIFLTLLLVYSGLSLQFGNSTRLTRLLKKLKEVIFYLLVILILTFASNAVQYTPFPPIDEYIVFLETSMGINLVEWMAWTSAHPAFKAMLNFLYYNLLDQMIVFPLIIIAAGRYHLIREYYFFLLTSAIIGLTFYYFFPTTAPASVLESPYFNQFQQATGLKFWEIHHHIKPSTLEGGLIALPSFHVIWAWFCLYMLREWRILFYIFAPINFFLSLSCVLLGWHYPIDLLGSVIVILITHFLHYLCHNFRRESKT